MTQLNALSLARRLSDKIEYLTPSSPTDYTLSSAFKAGEGMTVVNDGTSTLTVKASNGTTIDVLGKSKATFISLIDSPTAPSNWYQTSIEDVGPYLATGGATHSGLSAGSPLSAYIQALTIVNSQYGIQNGLAADLHTFTFPATGWYQGVFSIQMDVNNAVTSVNTRLESMGGTATRYHVSQGSNPSDFLVAGEISGEAQTCPTHGVILPLIKVNSANQTFQTKFNYSIAINGNLNVTLFVNFKRISRL